MDLTGHGFGGFIGSADLRPADRLATSPADRLATSPAGLFNPASWETTKAVY